MDRHQVAVYVEALAAGTLMGWRFHRTSGSFGFDDLGMLDGAPYLLPPLAAADQLPPRMQTARAGMTPIALKTQCGSAMAAPTEWRQAKEIRTARARTGA